MELVQKDEVQNRVSDVDAVAQNLVAQAERMEISNAEDLAKGGDLVKIISNQIKKSEEVRKALVKPLSDHVKWINSQFKPKTDILNGAKRTAQGKLDQYVRWEAEQLRKADAEAKRLAEEQALAQAESAASEEEQSEILDQAVKASEKPSGRVVEFGNYATTSQRKTWKLEVIDVTSIPVDYLVNLAEDEVSVVDAVLPVLGLNRAKVKEYLKGLPENTEESTGIPGLRLYKAITAQVR